MSKIYLESLSPKGLNVFKKLTNFADFGHLAGGTALALQLKHRESVDFDIFTPEEIKKDLLRKCRKVFGENLEVLINSPDQLTFLVPEKINITFVFYWYKKGYKNYAHKILARILYRGRD
ncbi:nucleotidyl transferase AbiEii/AbiGii toxin family protein [Candidatus Gottesmanbacteria bacterium]|nr:nucleotidyl transferase AbiEii/AbiGii toxin family protein [Candidatus Gottesmanbacteria bacterium]